MISYYKFVNFFHGGFSHGNYEFCFSSFAVKPPIIDSRLVWWLVMMCVWLCVSVWLIVTYSCASPEHSKGSHYFNVIYCGKWAIGGWPVIKLALGPTGLEFLFHTYCLICCLDWGKPDTVLAPRSSRHESIESGSFHSIAHSWASANDRLWA